MPDLVAVLANGAVGREPAARGGVEQGLAVPGLLVAVAAGELFPRIHVAAEVGHDQVGIVVVHELVVDALEVARKTRKGVVLELVHHAAQTLAIVVERIPSKVAVRRPELLDLGSGQAKDGLVLAAGQVGDLDVGAVEGAQRNGAVHHELHVGRARGLLAGRGDLLRDLGGGVDELGVAHAEVGDKADLHDLIDAGIVVDDVGNGVNEADGLLGKGVARGGLAAKDEGRRRHVEVGIGDATVVDVHHLHDIHMVRTQR